VKQGRYELLVDADEGLRPIGVMIARELLRDGADWAVMVELRGLGVLVDNRGVPDHRRADWRVTGHGVTRGDKHT